MPHQSKFVSNGDGHYFEVLGGDQITIKLTSADTDGRFTLLETIVPPSAGPPRHLHRRESETFYVLEGQFEFELDGNVTKAGPGDVIMAPPNLPHGFRNVGKSPGKLLIFCQPGGFEEFVKDFATLPLDQPPDPVKLAEMGAKYGVEFLPPAS